MINTIFFGTHKESIKALETLVSSATRTCGVRVSLAAVCTTPDKIVGRNKHPTPTPTKQWAMERNVPVIEAETTQELENKLLKFLSDNNITENLLGVVCYFGILIPKNIISKFNPHYGILNIHPSLLPGYRGSAPGQWAIINGETETGVTIIKISPQFDEGEVVAQEKIPIPNKIEPPELYDKLFTLGAKTLKGILPLWVRGNIQTKKQEGTTTLAPKLTKEDGYIDFKKYAPKQIEQRIRGLKPWPGAWTYLKDITEYYGIKPRKNGLVVVKLLSSDVNDAQNPSLRLTKLQPEAKQPMSWEEFKNGYLG